jgi:hypothetical protein
VGRFARLRRRVPSRGQLGQRAVPDRLAGVFEQPGERNPMLVRKFQERSWVGTGNGGKDRGEREVAVGRTSPKLYDLAVLRLARPASRNSELAAHCGWLGALATSTAVLTVTRSC